MQASARRVAEAQSIRLGAVGQPAQAELDGFKSRAVRAAAPTQRHLYATEWRALDALGAASTAMAVIAGASSSVL